jgi:hypothetical protein
MTAPIPRGVLSDRFRDRIDGRRIEAAVFTTFCFEPGFFELEILSLLFDGGLSQAPKVRLLMLEERVREHGPIAVYYDRRALIADDPPKLDVRRIAMARDGFFHPKVALVLLSAPVDPEDPSLGREHTLLVGILSANLTKAGWWENVECAWLDEIAEGSRCSYRQDLQFLLHRILDDEASLPTRTKNDRAGNAHAALERIRAFIAKSDNVADDTRRTARRRLQPRLFVGQDAMSLAEFVADVLRLPEDTYNLEVLSPYFGDDSAGPLQALQSALQPKETRVLLPRSEDGTAECTSALYAQVAQIADWGALPGDLLSRGKSATKDQRQRFVHAKVYRLWSRAEKREYLVVGSPNLTGPAHAPAGAGNLEAAAVFEVEDPGPLRFWLSPVESTPVSFSDTLAGEPLGEPEVPPLHVEHHWEAAQARVFWDGATPPEWLELRSANVALGRLEDLPAREWAACTPAVNEAMARALESTCFIEVHLPDGTAGTVLVREEGMAHKPSLLTSLSAEEILRYWSMLTAEQRQALLEDKLAAELRSQGLLPDGGGADGYATESMFDRFAGIFHAFHHLDAHVRGALDEARPKEAVYRLYGAKHDSLPHLVHKVLEAPEEDTEAEAPSTVWDPVHRYVTLLTAMQVMRAIRRDYPDFVQENAAAHRKLTEALAQRADLHRQLNLGAGNEPFLQWLEAQFLAEAAE